MSLSWIRGGKMQGPALLVGLAVLAATLHIANLVYLGHQTGCGLFGLDCEVSQGPWSTPDAADYLGVAGEIGEQGFLGASYLHRSPGYPLLLALSLSLTGSPLPALWLAALLAGVAAAAAAWIAWAISGRVGAAFVAGGIFCIWPNVYQFTPLLLTDAMHAYLTLVALACSLAYRRSERTGVAGLAAVFWVAAQSTRPTFLAIGLFLPLLLWKRNAGSRYRNILLSLCLATCVVPGFLIGSNRYQHGIATASALGTESLACFAVPRLKEELGLGRFSSLRRECHATRAGEEPAASLRRRRQEAVGFLLDHKAATIRSFAIEVREQLLSPLRPYYKYGLAPLYSGWPALGRGFLAGYWLLAVAALLAIGRRDRGLALFLVASSATILLPAAMVHWVEGRLRLPLDLHLLPLVACLPWLVRDALGSRFFGRDLPK